MAAENEQASSPINNKDEDDDEIFDESDIIKAPKVFLAKSLAESLFNGLLQKVRNRGIPPQRGFLHLNKVCGYGSSASTQEYHREPIRKLHSVQNLLHSTRRLTKQAIQEACEKERQQRLLHHEQNGIPRYRSFIDFLDEYRHLVREAEKRDQTEAMRKQQSVQSSWPAVLEEIRHRGVVRSINEQVESQRQDTIRSLWAVAFNKLSRREISAMASIHDNKQIIHTELKNVLNKKKNEAVLKEVQIIAHYNDLKDQLISSFRRKTLALQIRQQVGPEVRFRLEQNEKLRNDNIRRQIIANFELLHKELKKIRGKLSIEPIVNGNNLNNYQKKKKKQKKKSIDEHDNVTVDNNDYQLFENEQDDPIRERARLLTNIVQMETVANTKTFYSIRSREEDDKS